MKPYRTIKRFSTDFIVGGVFIHLYNIFELMRFFLYDGCIGKFFGGELICLLERLKAVSWFIFCLFC